MALNNVLQWAGTVFILGMYVASNFFKEEHDVRNALGLLGGLCYFAWTVRVRNHPQMLVNVVAISVCAVGLLKAYG